ncbi:MAG: HIT domain-containing protein [Candidatus Hydrogenedentota bacterium]|nr:MAG: HIT domain-containing protein [Candidatus Hydrogenedentota bacterium]
MKRRILFVPGKLPYVRGERPKVDCILCAVLRDDPRVDRLVLARDRSVFVTLNLYPYNPGHVMVVPRRHIVDPREATESERRAMALWRDRVMDALDEIYSPAGYNIGYNVGKRSGASLEHLHLHVVPRYKNEIGFLDVLSGTRVIVEEPGVSARKISGFLRKYRGGTKEKKR